MARWRRHSGTQRPGKGAGDSSSGQLSSPRAPDAASAPGGRFHRRRGRLRGGRAGPAWQAASEPVSGAAVDEALVQPVERGEPPSKFQEVDGFAEEGRVRDHVSAPQVTIAASHMERNATYGLGPSRSSFSQNTAFSVAARRRKRTRACSGVRRETVIQKPAPLSEALHRGLDLGDVGLGHFVVPGIATDGDEYLLAGNVRDEQSAPACRRCVAARTRRAGRRSAGSSLRRHHAR